MQIKFTTIVDGYYSEIMARFDRNLFEALAPPLIPFKIISFTGSQTNDIVHLRFGGWFATEWISRITHHGQDEHESFFIDVGTKLPFPLKSWHHRHIVRKLDAKKSYIIDDINFQSTNRLLTYLIYPVLFLGFKKRGEVYKQYFRR